MSADIKLKDARLRGRTGQFTILIKDETIQSVNHDSSARAEVTIDAKGGLVTESFVIAHLHLDKVLTGEKVGTSALDLYQSDRMKTKEAIKIASSIKASYTEDDITKRVTRILELAIRYGATHIRGFVDVDTNIGLLPMNTILKLKHKFKDKINLQLVAFPQEGILESPGCSELIEKAMEAGADVVGGIPWIERGNANQRRHIIQAFEIAKKFRAPVAMLVDDSEDRNLKTLDMLAEQTIRYRWQGMVEACHARAMQFYDKRELQRTIKLCKMAKIGLVSSPHTGPYCAPIKTLDKSGITVALGQDDCDDAYYPYGRCKMVEIAYLASHILRMMTSKEIDLLYDWITKTPARIMGYENFGTNPGNKANLVVFKEKSVREIISNQSEPSAVVHEGRLLYGGIP
ncbi:MAG: amidohydrolase family protein [Nitrososphaerota archaeon]|jgi:cytosine deaminase|nr:amidohydrolase family protein [Nitrososphaerota archaeon]